MKSGWKRFLSIGLMLVILVVAGIGVARWYLFGRDVGVPGSRPPAPSAPAAPAWLEGTEPVPGVESPSPGPMDPGEEGDPPSSPPDPATGEEPDYGWPDDFELPLHIEIEVPEVPEEISHPAAPIEEDEPEGTEDENRVEL